MTKHDSHRGHRPASIVFLTTIKINSSEEVAELAFWLYLLVQEQIILQEEKYRISCVKKQAIQGTEKNYKKATENPWPPFYLKDIWKHSKQMFLIVVLMPGWPITSAKRWLKVIAYQHLNITWYLANSFII